MADRRMTRKSVPTAMRLPFQPDPESRVLALPPFAQREVDVARVGKAKLIEEERPGVGRRRHVEEVERCPRIQVLQVLRRKHVDDDRIRGGPVRAREHGEAQFVGGFLQHLQVGSGESRARHDDGGEIADARDEDVVAGTIDAEFHQGGDGQADDAAELDRRARRVPTGYSEQAVRIQRGEKCLPALNGVEPVLRERECAGTGGGPGIDHAHFDQVEFLLGPCEPAPAVVDHEARSRQVGDAGVGAQLGRIREEVDEDGIELDAGNVAEPEQMGRQHIAPAADPDDGGAATVAGVVGEIGYVVAQEIQAAGCVGVLRHPRPRHPVDGHIALLERDVARRRRRGPPEKRRAHDGDRHSDAGKRIPLDVIDIAERIEPAELDHDGLQAGIGHGIQAGKRCQADGDETRFAENAPVQDGAGRNWLGGGTAKAPGGDRGQGRYHEHGRRRVHPCQQSQRGEAAGRGAEQVDAIGDAYREATACQGERHRNTADRERCREQHNGLEPEHDVGRPCHAWQGRGELQGKAGGDAQREGRRYPRQEGVDVPRIHVIELVVDDQGAAGEPQHGHADREERHVVERNDGKDARLDDLNHQDGHA